MDKEKLEKANELIKSIEARKYELDHVKYETIKLVQFKEHDTGYVSSYFTLKPDQTKMIHTLALSLAKENLAKLEREFEGL